MAVSAATLARGGPGSWASRVKVPKQPGLIYGLIGA
jgi:hypothetical protein